MPERRVTVGDGKYTFVRDENGLMTAVLRHGEPWPVAFEAFQHDNALHALLNRIEELEASERKLEAELAAFSLTDQEAYEHGFEPMDPRDDPSPGPRWGW